MNICIYWEAQFSNCEWIVTTHQDMSNQVLDSTLSL